MYFLVPCVITKTSKSRIAQFTFERPIGFWTWSAVRGDRFGTVHGLFGYLFASLIRLGNIGIRVLATGCYGYNNGSPILSE